MFEQNQQLNKLVNQPDILQYLQQQGVQNGQVNRRSAPQIHNYGNNSPRQQGFGPNGIMPIQMQNLEEEPQGWGDWWKEYFGGTKDRQITQYPHTQQQYGAYNNLLEQGQKTINDPYAGFGPLRDETMRRYREEIIPQTLAGYHGGSGTSPNLVRQLGNQASGLASMLNAQQAQWGQQNREFGLRQTELGLTPQFNQQFVPGKPGLLQNIQAPLAQGAGMAAGALALGALL